MKRIIVILGVTAAMAIAPSVASAGGTSSGPQNGRPSTLVAGSTFQTSTDSRSGHTLYRTGNTGLWME